MTPAAPTALRYATLASTLLLWLLAVFFLLGDSPLHSRLRGWQWDAQQRLSPRERINDSAVIVAIDDDSLRQLGQWPWPRQRLAELFGLIQFAEPAAVGVDIVFAETDRYSPSTLRAALGLKAGDSAGLATLPDGDAALANAWQGAPLVIGSFGLLEAASAKPAGLHRQAIADLSPHAAAGLPQFADALRSLPRLRETATTEALLNAEPEHGMLRKLPTFTRVGDAIVPGLAFALLQRVAGETEVIAIAHGQGIRAIQSGALRIPTDADGSWRLHFSDFRQRPHLSAASLLSDPTQAELLRGRIVLVGYTASGLLDVVQTPLGAMPGVEAHAEALDNYFDGRLLQRPWFALALELLAFTMISGTALVLLWRYGIGSALAAFTTAALVSAAASHGAFVAQGWLLDSAAPVLAAGVVLALQSGLSLAQARAQRRALAAELQLSREQQARLEGELDAARRIQNGMLPQAAQVLAGEQRVHIAASMQAARWVGGDFYDCFIERDRLWFLVGDVSGKGLPAALFMALAKGALRRAAASCPDAPGLALSRTSEELSEANAEQQFVTVLLACMDLNSGHLQLASAGHEAPWLLATSGVITPLVLVGGPPLGVLDHFDYPSEHAHLEHGEGLCLFTDGATDARNPSHMLLGREGFLAMVQAFHGQATDACLRGVEERLKGFVDTAEATDDITLMFVQRRA